MAEKPHVGRGHILGERFQSTLLAGAVLDNMHYAELNLYGLAWWSGRSSESTARPNAATWARTAG